MKDIIYTKHLLERLRGRGISESDLRSAVSHPTIVQNSRTSDAKKFIKNFSHYQLIAIVKSERDNWILKTAWKKPYYSSTPRNRSTNFLERLIYDGLSWLEETIRRRFNL